MRGGFGKFGHPIARERSGVPPGLANATASTGASVRPRIRIEPHRHRACRALVRWAWSSRPDPIDAARRTTAGLMSIVSARQTKYDRAQLWLLYLFRRLRGGEPLHDALLFFRPLLILAPDFTGKDAHFGDDRATARKL